MSSTKSLLQAVSYGKNIDFELKTAFAILVMAGSGPGNSAIQVNLSNQASQHCPSLPLPLPRAQAESTSTETSTPLA